MTESDDRIPTPLSTDDGAPSADARAESESKPVLPDHLAPLQWIVDALDDKRAKDIVAIDLAPLTASVDAFVIATAESQPQLQALEEAVRERMKANGQRARGIEAPSSRWVLIDYGGIVVHLMSPEAREFYDLEGLWADAEPIEVAPG